MCLGSKREQDLQTESYGLKCKVRRNFASFCFVLSRMHELHETSGYDWEAKHARGQGKNLPLFFCLAKISKGGWWKRCQVGSPGEIKRLSFHPWQGAGGGSAPGKESSPAVHAGIAHLQPGSCHFPCSCTSASLLPSGCSAQLLLNNVQTWEITPRVFHHTSRCVCLV